MCPHSLPHPATVRHTHTHTHSNIHTQTRWKGSDSVEQYRTSITADSSHLKHPGLYIALIDLYRYHNLIVTIEVWWLIVLFSLKWICMPSRSSVNRRKSTDFFFFFLVHCATATSYKWQALNSFSLWNSCNFPQKKKASEDIHFIQLNNWHWLDWLNF